MNKIQELLKNLNLEAAAEVDVVEAGEAFEVYQGGELLGEFLVLTDEEAADKFAEYETELIEEIGLDAFSGWAQDFIKENFLNKNWFDDVLNESSWAYIDDIRGEGNRLKDEMDEAECKDEEEFLEFLTAAAGDSAEWFIENFGMDYLTECIKRDKLLNIPDVIEWIEYIDGRGGALAAYDGIEIEAGDYYIYRIN